MQALCLVLGLGLSLGCGPDDYAVQWLDGGSELRVYPGVEPPADWTDWWNYAESVLPEGMLHELRVRMLEGPLPLQGHARGAAGLTYPPGNYVLLTWAPCMRSTAASHELAWHVYPHRVLGLSFDTHSMADGKLVSKVPPDQAALHAETQQTLDMFSCAR